MCCVNAVRQCLGCPRPGELIERRLVRYATMYAHLISPWKFYFYTLRGRCKAMRHRAIPGELIERTLVHYATMLAHLISPWKFHALLGRCKAMCHRARSGELAKSRYRYTSEQQKIDRK